MCSALLLISCTPFQFFMTYINMFLHASVYCTYLFYLIFVFLTYFFHLTDGRILCCACAFIHWMKEVFTAFVHMNITIMWFLFLFRRAQSIFLSLIIIITQKNYMSICFLVTCYCDVYDLQFLTIPIINYRLNCLVDVSNFFVDTFCSMFVQFNSFGAYPKVLFALNKLINLVE